jgi:hypothetical protein
MTEKKDDLGIGMGLLTMLAAGPLVSGQIAEAEHTFCEDCANWTGETGYSSDGECTSDDMIYFRDTPREDVRFMRNGPLWPGCRGFKLREGAKGPRLRAHEAIGKAYVAARRAAAAVDGDETEEKR